MAVTSAEQCRVKARERFTLKLSSRWQGRMSDEDLEGCFALGNVPVIFPQ
jgi:hypothetical protein